MQSWPCADVCVTVANSSDRGGEKPWKSMLSFISKERGNTHNPKLWQIEVCLPLAPGCMARAPMRMGVWM